MMEPVHLAAWVAWVHGCVYLGALAPARAVDGGGGRPGGTEVRGAGAYQHVVAGRVEILEQRVHDHQRPILPGLGSGGIGSAVLAYWLGGTEGLVAGGVRAGRHRTLPRFGRCQGGRGPMSA